MGFNFLIGKRERGTSTVPVAKRPFPWEFGECMTFYLIENMQLKGPYTCAKNHVECVEINNGVYAVEREYALMGRNGPIYFFSAESLSPVKFCVNEFVHERYTPGQMQKMMSDITLRNLLSGDTPDYSSLFYLIAAVLGILVLVMVVF